jgi:tetratricopeptide (TPR) repeat protein
VPLYLLGSRITRPPMSTRFQLPRALLIVAIGALCASGWSCSRERPPEPSPEAYREAVTAFYSGLSAMQTTQEVLAREKFDRVIALVPQEPAAWANLGLLLLRQQELDQAADKLARAAAIAPDSAAIQRLQALAESRRGNLAEALRHWRRALELDPADLEAAYALALETERLGGPANDADAERMLGQLLTRRENLAARLEYVRLAAKRGDQAAITSAIAPLSALSRAWPPAAQDQLAAVVTAAADNPRSAATRVAFLKNVLLRESAYRTALAEISTPREEVGRPVMRFLRLKNPDPQPASADETLAFTIENVPDAPPRSSWVGAVSLTGDDRPVLSAAGPSGIHLAGMPGDAGCRAWSTTAGSDPLTPDAVAAADLNYDFRVDLALAGASGLCLLRQDAAGRFADVTAATKLPPAILRAAAFGVWPADIDLDGDLDLVLAPRDGHPLVLRNNGDGTITPRDLFAVTRVRGFAWADLDGDGVPDASFLDDAGLVHVFVNLRGGAFRAETLPDTNGTAVAIAVVQRGGDTLFDLLVLAGDGTITSLARSAGDASWTRTRLSRVDPPARLEPGVARLLTADLDNNGAADLIVAGPSATSIVLGAPGGGYSVLRTPLALGAQGAADLDGDGRLELVGLGPGGQPVRAVSRGAKSYHWQVIRPRATTATGDQRINSFGIGGEIELRSGLHLQKQVITSPIVHFGLGDATGADLVRITWPNGVLQAEFDTKADQAIKATQRLKGSCPWLFAWNGREMSFVTDLIWRSPLGLRINAQATADVLMTEDWVKVRGDQLAPRDGAYDLRITAELWETHFFDLTSLMVVDHPDGTEVFVDERFAVPPPPLRVVPTGPVQPFAAVRDDHGGDVADLAATRDSRYVDFAGRGPYQGITRAHFVEMELPSGAPRTGPLWLVAQGWIHPTDSSINVAIAQGAHAAPQGLSLQVADAAGHFREVRAGLGFPSGKDKTILVDLTGLFGATGARRLRLATNLEIFWDRLGWANGRPDVPVHPRRLDLLSADLSYRGYSVLEPQAPSVPERPRYALAGTSPRWRDLEGYYTRFGDVRELLTTVDDRYVIMNAGDELRLRFPEAPPPARGLVRDFIMIGDGWVKDGDYNTTFSRTVLPLPTHQTGRYDAAPGRLEDDPVYRRHTGDFADYHTRYVTPDLLRDALRALAGANAPGAKHE